MKLTMATVLSICIEEEKCLVWWSEGVLQREMHHRLSVQYGNSLYTGMSMNEMENSNMFAQVLCLKKELNPHPES